MEQGTILLNGGTDQDVEPAEGSDEFLSRLLGEAAVKPAVASLRIVQDPTGHNSVGVLIGTRQVGHLPPTIGASLMDTVIACEEHGVAARARGTLSASPEQPGKVELRLSLADPEHLLVAPEAAPVADDTQAIPDHEAAPALQGDLTMPEKNSPSKDLLTAELEHTASDSGLTSALEEADAFFMPPDEPDDLSGMLSAEHADDSSAEPELSAGVAEDWPEWPPPSPRVDPTLPPEPPTQPPMTSPVDAQQIDMQPVETPPAEFQPLQSGPTPQTRSIFGPGPQPPAAPMEDSPPLQPLQSDPSGVQSGLPGASPQAPQTLPLGGSPQTNQSGYLAAPKSPEQTNMGAMAGVGVGLAAGAGGASTPGNSSPGASSGDQGQSWQDFNTAPSKPATAPPPDWTPSAAASSAMNPGKPPTKHNNIATWVISIVAVFVVATAGFFVWKTQFAPQTYTDAQYAYSFTYPGTWQFSNRSADFPLVVQSIPSTALLDIAGAGSGVDSTIEGYRLMGVMVLDPQALGLVPNLGAKIQANLDMNMQMAFGWTLDEPLAPTTLAGLTGYVYGFSYPFEDGRVTSRNYFLLDGDLLYVVLVEAESSIWHESQDAFTEFLSSFQPGGTRI